MSTIDRFHCTAVGRISVATRRVSACHSTWPFRHSIITWNTLYQHLYRLLVAYKCLRVPLSSVQFHGTRQQTSRRLQGSGGHFLTGGIPKLQLAGCSGHMFALHQKVRVLRASYNAAPHGALEDEPWTTCRLK